MSRNNQAPPAQAAPRPTPAPAGSRRPRVRWDLPTLAVQGATLLGGVLLLGGLVQLLLEEPADLAPVLALGLPGVLVLRWLAGSVAEDEDRSFLMRVMWAGLLLRLGLTLVVHYSLPVWFFAPDQITYEDVGWRTLQYHRGAGPIPWQIEGTAEVGYFYWNAFLYLIFGFAPLAPKLVNAFVGTASALLCYRLAGELAGKGPARTAALLTMFFPSLVLWSALNLRDPVVLLITVALFLNVVRLRIRPSGMAFFGVLLALALLVLFRDYMAIMALLGILGATFIGKGRGIPVNLFVGAIIFGVALFAYQRFGLGSEWVESASFEAIAQQRQNMAFGGTAFRPEVDVSTPLRGLQYLPMGLAFFFLSPFPWQLGSALSLMTLPEQLLWYALLPAVGSGALYIVRQRYHAFGPVLVFMLLTSALYALVEGNAGTAYRHRAQVLVFFLVLAGVGLTLRRLRREAATRKGRRR